MQVSLLLGLLLLSPASTPSEDKIDSKLLLGKWQPEKVPDGVDKLTVEYFKEGKLKIDVEAQGGMQTFEGTYKVEGNKLNVKINFNGNEQNQTRKISKLTEKEMVTVSDENNEERKYKKVK